MSRRFLLALGVLVALSASAVHGEVALLFSPLGGCDQALVKLARASQMYLDAACYTFSLGSVADELIAAKGRGVRVRVIADRSQAPQTWAPAKRLVAAGIPVKVNSHAGLMHDKFLVADGKSIATGSFNWTKAAVEKNDENLVVFTQEPAVAATFAAQFDRMWADTTRFAAFSPSTLAKAPARLPAAVVPQTAASANAETVYITKSGTKYHRASCRFLSKSKIAISRKEAEERGYTPCKVCKP